MVLFGFFNSLDRQTRFKNQQMGLAPCPGSVDVAAGATGRRKFLSRGCFTGKAELTLSRCSSSGCVSKSSLAALSCEDRAQTRGRANSWGSLRLGCAVPLLQSGGLGFTASEPAQEPTPGSKHGIHISQGNSAGLVFLPKASLPQLLWIPYFSPGKVRFPHGSTSHVGETIFPMRFCCSFSCWCPEHRERFVAPSFHCGSHLGSDPRGSRGRIALNSQGERGSSQHILVNPSVKNCNTVPE